MRFGSLFSGIGGFDLGFERAGMECAWQVESDPFCRRVLTKHWPAVSRYGDIREINWREVESVDVVCGGFPCQPVSLAGKRLAQDDERWLWPEFARCLRALRPRYAVVENVPGLLVRGFGDVLGDLAALGYDAEWELLPAAAFGAPHLRFRVFVVAYSSGAGLSFSSEQGDGRTALREGEAQPGRRGSATPNSESFRRREGRQGRLNSSGARQPESSLQELADPDSSRREILAWGSEVEVSEGFGAAGGESFRTRASEQWRTEPALGRVAHGVPGRVDRIRSLGNAVVPQLAEWIARRIMRFG